MNFHDSLFLAQFLAIHDMMPDRNCATKQSGKSYMAVSILQLYYKIDKNRPRATRLQRFFLKL